MLNQPTRMVICGINILAELVIFAHMGHPCYAVIKIITEYDLNVISAALKVFEIQDLTCRGFNLPLDVCLSFNLAFALCVLISIKCICRFSFVAQKLDDHLLYAN